MSIGTGLRAILMNFLGSEDIRYDLVTVSLFWVRYDRVIHTNN